MRGGTGSEAFGRGHGSSSGSWGKRKEIYLDIIIVLCYLSWLQTERGSIGQSYSKSRVTVCKVIYFIAQFYTLQLGKKLLRSSQHIAGSTAILDVETKLLNVTSWEPGAFWTPTHLQPLVPPAPSRRFCLILSGTNRKMGTILVSLATGGLWKLVFTQCPEEMNYDLVKDLIVKKSLVTQRVLQKRISRPHYTPSMYGKWQRLL